MRKNKEPKQRYSDLIKEVETTISDYQQGIGSGLMKQNDKGEDELTMDLRTVPLYKDCSNDCLLNPDIYDYAEEAASLFRKHNKLTIRWLFADGISEEEKKKVQTIFRTHYANAFKLLRETLTKELIIAIIFVFTGFLFLSLHWPYVDANSSSIFGEILDIFGWVLIWEAGSILFINSVDNQRELKRDLFFFKAEAVEEETKPQ